jgi:chitinase
MPIFIIVLSIVPDSTRSANRQVCFALVLLFALGACVERSGPFRGHAASVPGIIQMEDFDDGSAEVAYHDSSPANEGGYYRDTAVDIELCDDKDGGLDVSYVNAGEWLNYTVDVEREGRYTVRFRVASEFAGAVFHLEAGGERTEPIAMPNTAWWQFWKDVTGHIRLKYGRQVLRFVVDSTIPAKPAGNFNYMRLTLD